MIDNQTERAAEQLPTAEVMRLYRMDVVYPGHPSLIAMQIMANYKTYEEAKRPVPQGWESALSCRYVRGAGGAVMSAMTVMSELVAHPHDPAIAFQRGCEIWNESRKSDMPDRREAGNEQAERIKDEFMQMARSWLDAQTLEAA